MSKIVPTLIVVLVAAQASAAWYWPFDGDKNEKPRMSELLEPASVLMDTASDLAGDKKYAEAIAAYNKALIELDRLEAENPDRVDLPEFTTVRNKRAIINSSIDTLLMQQVKENARAVSVTDTTELEKRHARLKAEKRAAKNSGASTGVRASSEGGAWREKLAVARSLFAAKDFEAASRTLAELLEERPNAAAALNLKAAVEMSRGDERAAEETLYQAINSNPNSHYAYYNMSRLVLRTRGDDGLDAARRYYEAGRSQGGPVDAKLEARFK